MKKTLLLLFLILFASVVFAQKSLAVATFDIVSDAVSKEEAEIITDLCITELNATGVVHVINRIDFENSIRKLKFQKSDWNDGSKTAEIGKTANVELLGYGQIIKLGEKYSVSITIINPESALVLSYARMNPDTLGDVFKLVSSFANTVINGLMPKIGDKGPGDGTICYIKGNNCIEFSDILGKVNFEEAKTLCNDYIGGGFKDWYLPSKDELNYIYNCLKTQEKTESKWYWSSTLADDDGYGWGQRFSDGYQGNPSLKNIHFVRAVRAFTY